MVWCGVVWCGVVWCGVVWCGVVWCGVVWRGVVWCGVVWCGVVWCGVVRCGVVWCGAARCGMVWCAVYAHVKWPSTNLHCHSGEEHETNNIMILFYCSLGLTQTNKLRRFSNHDITLTVIASKSCRTRWCHFGCALQLGLLLVWGAVI